MAPSTRERIIKEASPLVRRIAETEYAAQALEKQKLKIADLDKEIEAKRTDVRRASQTIEDKLTDFEKLQDSHVRRLGYKLAGKEERFEEKTSQEETAWQDAIRAKYAREEKLEELFSKRRDAGDKEWTLSSNKHINNETKKALESLTKGIFSGPPPPEFPEEGEQRRLIAEVCEEAKAVDERADHAIEEILKGYVTARRIDLATAEGKLRHIQSIVWHASQSFMEAQQNQPLIESIGLSVLPKLDAKPPNEKFLELLKTARTRSAEELEKVRLRFEAFEPERQNAWKTCYERRGELQNLRMKIIMDVAGIDKTA
ncbi:hypothetical protein HYALB_00009375 [Hymenoscyphus albidus]|uniref:Uncharacterized protein n=1 Tax=Hymenoscyphus albidus TaxID=595503 RepID=A0A9N9LKA4_9HELO|nr:hypothetical protein HYALB_00009375 [Hymenoscyphus albidus]